MWILTETWSARGLSYLNNIFSYLLHGFLWIVQSFSLLNDSCCYAKHWPGLVRLRTSFYLRARTIKTLFRCPPFAPSHCTWRDETFSVITRSVGYLYIIRLSSRTKALASVCVGRPPRAPQKPRTRRRGARRRRATSRAVATFVSSEPFRREKTTGNVSKCDKEREDGLRINCDRVWYLP